MIVKNSSLQYLNFITAAFLVFNDGISLAVTLPFAEVQIDSQTTSDLVTDANSLFSQGEELSSNGRYQEAIINYHQALRIYRNVNKSFEEGQTLKAIGIAYYRLGHYSEAINFFRQAQITFRRSNNQDYEAKSLNNLGIVYDTLGQYVEAIKFYQKALAIYYKTNNFIEQAATSNNIAFTYYNLNEYSKALDHYQKALVIVQEVGDYEIEGLTLHGIGNIYLELGQYRRALEFYQQALSALEWISDPSAQDYIFEGYVFDSIGFCYFQQGLYLQAINFYQKALLSYRRVGELFEEGHTLSKLGEAYRRSGQYLRALEVLEQAVRISQELGSHSFEGEAFDSLGNVYRNQGKDGKALEFYQRSLVVSRDVGDRDRERITLSNLGSLLTEQNQPELAIIFYKRSVNVTESIRRGIQGLPVEQQQSYINTVADTYRKLADLLLQQDRVLEAQQVLDLLKVQEVQDYLRRGVRGSEQTAQGVDLLPQERSVSDQFDAGLDQAIALGRELTELEAISRENRTVEQQQRVIELRQIQENVQLAFTDFLSQTEVQAAIRKLRQTPEAQNIEPASLTLLRQNLQNLQQDAVLLYPLILEDRLELVLLSPDAPPIHRSVPVGRVRLNQAISEMLTVLKDPDSDATVPAQQLYDWLIRPIEADLKQANAQTILYAPDGQLRYLPLAALHDGQQWLVEQYRINHITALSLYNLTAQPQTQPNVLAAAFGEGRFNVQRGAFRYPFSGLPFAKAEIETLASLFPNTTQLIDRAFNRDAILLQLNDYKIVHLATHAQFVTGQPEDSFIVLGDGDSLTLREMDGLSLTNVDLIVLSACETAVSLGDGKEILGFGYQIQQAGARAAIASLWAVDDGGTQVLMSHFYDLLRQGNLTKTAALQQAQIALIAQKPAPTAQAMTQRQVGDPEAPTAEALAHPYYWAPFILIGNGL